MTDAVVFAHRNGRDYVGCFDDDWWVWPAEQDGWRRRQRWTARSAEGYEELPPRLASLALRLSGVPRD